MKKFSGFALGPGAAVVALALFANEARAMAESTAPSSAVTEPPRTTGSLGYATSTVAPGRDYAPEAPPNTQRDHVRGGIGLNVFGAAGTKDSARLGLGARIEYVLPIGVALGGSYTSHWNGDADRTSVRPLLAEAGWAFPVLHHLEVRPMVGIGYAFATISTDTKTDNTATTNQSVSATGTASAGGFDFAPGAKVSYVARSFEVFALPKYHFITDNNFLGVEVGAGARF